MRRIYMAALLLALAGCANMSFEECVTADWHAVGFEDGAGGRGMDAFSDRREACADHGVTPGFATYMTGRSQGLTLYCRPQNGYLVGTRGHVYGGVCPPELEARFVAAHSDGYGLYRLKATQNRIGKRLRYSKNKANQIEHELAEKTALLISPGLDTAQRATLAVELKHLAEERGEIAEAIVDLERRHAVAQHEYEAYLSRVSLRY